MKTEAFIELLMDKNGNTAKRLIENNADLGVSTAHGTSITLKSLLRYSFDGLDVDYLVYGTDNRDTGIQSVGQRKKDLATAEEIYPKLSEAFLTLARAIGGDSLVEHCQAAPTSRYEGSLKALFDTLQSVVDNVSPKTKESELCNVPGYTYDALIDQTKVLEYYFSESPFGGYDTTHGYSFAELVENIINDYMLLDQWFGHMVFDKMHIICAMAGKASIKFKGEEGLEDITVAEVIGAVCERLDERKPDSSDQAAQDAHASMRVRLEQVFIHVRKIAEPSLAYPQTPQGPHCITVNTLNTLPTFRGIDRRSLGIGLK